MAPAGTHTTAASAVDLLLPSGDLMVRCVVVGGDRSDDTSTIEAAIGVAEAGGRAVIAIDAEATQPEVDALGLGIVLGCEQSAPALADPLLADTTVELATPAGRRLQLDRVRPIRTNSDSTWSARTSTGEVVALELAVGAGRVIVIGTSSLLDDRWLTAADNAVTLADWMGAPDPGAAADQWSRSARPAPAPTPVPVVCADTGWLDPDLVGASGDEDEALVTLAGRLNRRLPEAVHDALVEFADRSHPSGALLIRGLPVGALPPTPEHPTAPTVKDSTSELVLLTVARRLGQPVGYLPEHGGTLWQNILPVRASLDRQVSTSSNVELMFHTEAAFHPHRPRFLLLLCLRGDPAARTTLCSITDLLPALPLAVRRTLFEPRFRTAADESYVGSRPTQLGAPMAVLSGDWERPSLVFDADLMVGIDLEADRALRVLADLVAEHHHGVVLEPGDLLVVDNQVAVHGRSPFRARFDGTDRWLQRSFVVGDLAPSAGQRRGRVITTRFAG